jgi:hypothetical protein
MSPSLFTIILLSVRYFVIRCAICVATVYKSEEQAKLGIAVLSHARRAAAEKRQRSA